MNYMSTKSQLTNHTIRNSWLATGSAATGFSALIGASCCVLPIVLVNLGVSSAMVANLAFLAQMKPYLLALTVALIVAALFIAFRGGRRPNGRTLGLLVFSTALALTAHIIPYYEREMLQWLNL